MLRAEAQSSKKVTLEIENGKTNSKDTQEHEQKPKNKN